QDQRVLPIHHHRPATGDQPVTLASQLTDYVNAAFTGLWVQTHEPDEAEREILTACQEQHWQAAIWDVAHGLRIPGHPGAVPPDTGTGDPLAALRSLPSLGRADGSALLILRNLHRFLSNPEVVQTCFNQLVSGKQQRAFVVVLAPVVQIPVELEKLF